MLEPSSVSHKPNQPNQIVEGLKAKKVQSGLKWKRAVRDMKGNQRSSEFGEITILGELKVENNSEKGNLQIVDDRGDGNGSVQEEVQCRVVRPELVTSSEPLVAAGLSSPPSPQLSSSSSSSSPPALAAAIANLSHRRHHLRRFHLIFGRFGSRPPRKADLALFAATGGRLAIWRRLSSRRI
ncbi:hypothetical protein LWI29_018458 [Acer saccharum]|uniref:Uncharacterized protein n=1 Tax=Acer saccharum TaxID=4024 RepID=A0AA39V8Q6_ACESA|nr:hypothetical protein LWI29_018458 [Acer saccharum]